MMTATPEIYREITLALTQSQSHHPWSPEKKRRCATCCDVLLSRARRRAEALLVLQDVLHETGLAAAQKPARRVVFGSRALVFSFEEKNPKKAVAHGVLLDDAGGHPDRSVTGILVLAAAADCAAEVMVSALVPLERSRRAKRALPAILAYKDTTLHRDRPQTCTGPTVVVERDPRGPRAKSEPVASSREPRRGCVSLTQTFARNLGFECDDT